LHSCFDGPFAEGAAGEIDGWVVSEGTWVTSESKSFSTMTGGEEEGVTETDGEKEGVTETDGEKEGVTETDGEKEGVSETDGEKEGVSETDGEKDSEGLALESRTSFSKYSTMLLDSVLPMEREDRVSKR